MSEDTSLSETSTIPMLYSISVRESEDISVDIFDIKAFISLDIFDIIMRKAAQILNNKIPRHLSQSRGFSSSAKMAHLDINSKHKMLSGYDIPLLGYGVSKYPYISYLPK